MNLRRSSFLLCMCPRPPQGLPVAEASSSDEGAHCQPSHRGTEDERAYRRSMAKPCQTACPFAANERCLAVGPVEKPIVGPRAQDRYDHKRHQRAPLAGPRPQLTGLAMPPSVGRAYRHPLGLVAAATAPTAAPAQVFLNPP
eukprot:TRINITY_DN76852_c0_g1_i1.p2 TRINITY_DN76852_c0_g1~~TRINITY_DN76852_c0_g1_i1.p2  ORF type:complete len:142 (+),score=3.50 TRINITY_DN76852_c0_g1_i1:583-1008(+)